MKKSILDIKPDPNWYEKLERTRIKNNKTLELRAKPLHELIVEENFTVKDVIATTDSTSFTPNSEIMIGGTSPVYNGGFTSKLTLEVSADNPDIPITTLDFIGFSVVKTGDYITAKIPKYKEEEEDLFGFGRGKTFYLDRDLTPKETAIELVILSSNGRTLRKDRAINYDNFMKN